MSRTVRIAFPPLVVAIVGLVVIFAVGERPSQQTVAAMLVSMIFAIGWNIIGGYAGQASFGQAAYFGLGAYTMTLLTGVGVPPLVGMWGGVIVAAVAALLIGLITFRLTGIYFALSTVVFPIILMTLAIYFDVQEVSFPYKPNQGILYFAPDVPEVLSLIALCATVAAVAISSLIENSKTGLYLHALRSDQGAAEASGVDTMAQKLLALVVSAALSAVAGALYCPAVLVLTPDGVFGLLRSVEPVIFTVFGGIGTLWGPLIGAGILHPLTYYLDTTLGGSLPGASGLLYGIALLIVILVFPQGLFWGIRSAFRRHFAAKGVSMSSARAVAHAEAFSAPSGTTTSAVGPPVLQIENVQKSFGGLHVLSQVTFEARKGEILGVIGPNGAGKTTLFNLINGFMPIDGGRIIVNGTDVAGLKPHQVFAHGIGRTFQMVRDFKRLTVVDNVMIPALTRGRGRRKALEIAEEALVEVGLAERAGVMVDELSTGELRRMELARAMCGDSSVFLLDEFLGGLGGQDATAILDVIRRVRARGVTIVAIEHTMHAMTSLVDRFVVLNFGRIIATGTAREVAENPEVVEAYLGKRWAARAGH